MKISFYEITEKWQEEYLRERLNGYELEFYPEVLNDDCPVKDQAEIISVFVNSRVTPKVFESADCFKFISTRSTGFDHINLEAAKKKGVIVSSVPSYGENTVAEFSFALLLALSRKIFPAVKRIKEEGLFSVDNLRGFDLMGKTIGVVGTGHIGQYVLKMANGFGMKIVAYDPYPNPKLAQEYNFTYVSLEDLLRVSDVVTLHVPYMPATHHLINKDNVKLFKKGSMLINTARGGLVDTAALVWALQNKIIAGAGLDVLEEEGFILDEIHLLTEGHPNEQQLKTVLADHELMHMQNVIVTPHNAFNTMEAMQRILDTTVANIKGFMEGKVVNQVKMN